MLNNITVMGRLTKEPELRYTSNQTPVCSFTIANDRDVKSGEERKTDFIDCVAWRSTAEFIDKYFSKGQMCIVVGRLQMRPWEDKNGAKRISAEVLVNTCYFGEKKKSDSDEDYDVAEPKFEAVDGDELNLPF